MLFLRWTPTRILNMFMVCARVLLLQFILFWCGCRSVLSDGDYDTKKRILIQDNYYSLIAKINALEKDVAELKTKAGYSQVPESVLVKTLDLDLKLQQALQRIEKLENETSNNNGLLPFDLFPRRALLISQLETDGWKLVFRAASGNGYPAYDGWTHGRGTCENKPLSMERSYSCNYRQRNLASWSTLGVRYVKFALYTQEKEEAYVIFNGIGSDMNNWFSKDRVISSSYSDLTAAGQYNFFSIAGDLNGNLAIRRFLINRDYPGCSLDRGHIAVIDEARTNHVCLMDLQPSYPQFLYSRTNSVCFWERATYGMADYLAVFVKLS